MWIRIILIIWRNDFNSQSSRDTCLRKKWLLSVTQFHKMNLEKAFGCSLYLFSQSPCKICPGGRPKTFLVGSITNLVQAEIQDRHYPLQELPWKIELSLLSSIYEILSNLFGQKFISSSNGPQNQVPIFQPWHCFFH